MSASDHDLSERLRLQTAALHEPAAAPLGGAAQQRVIERLQDEAQRAIVRSRQRRRAGAACAAIGIAAAVVLALRPSPRAVQPTAAKELALPSAGCGLPHLTQASQTLSLGSYGQLVADASADLAIEQSSACELVVRLRRGALAGDLHNLRPARLRILTAQAEVVVTGTRFSVRADDDFEVVLASGVVDVLFADRSMLRLSPGTTLRKPARAERAQTRPLSVADEQRLGALLRAEPVAAVSGSEPNSTEPVNKPIARSGNAPKRSTLDQAEAARQAGRYAEARQAYQRASLGHDENAEVALLRWVRLEVEVHDLAAALNLLARHQQRFANGHLGAEAGWLDVQIRQELNQPELARAAARRLVARHANTPQGAAAARMLGAQ